MRKFIINNATDILENIIEVNSDELPSISSGYRIEDDTGGRLGQRWTGSEWADVLPTVEELAAKLAARTAKIRNALDDQNSVNKVLLKIGFLQENRIRLLEGQAEVTAAQFRTWVESQIE